MATEDEIQEEFQKLGMNPERIWYIEESDEYRVNIGEEGTDKTFIEEHSGIGNENPIGQSLDDIRLTAMESELEGLQISSGTIKEVTTKGTSSDFRLQID